MVTASVSTYQVSPGRREEFIEALGTAKTTLEGLGANVQTRQIIAGGEATGRISSIALFENPAARAAFTDRVMEQQPRPLQAVLQTADAPAMLVARFWLNEVNPQPGSEIPDALNVLSANSHRIAPGHIAEADAAYMAAKSLSESLGQQAIIWQLTNAGANSGLRAITRGFESFSAQAEFLARAQERNEGGPGPIPRAVQSGTLEIVNQSVSTLVEV